MPEFDPQQCWQNDYTLLALLMLEGITTGFIFSIALFPGTVWLLKVGMSGTARDVFVTALGFILSQLFWLLVTIPGLMIMYKHLAFLRTGMHVFAAFVLGYVAVKFAGSRRVETLMHADHLPPGNILFRNAFNRAFAMPVRLPMAISILLATGAYINHHPTWEVIPVIVLGGMIGLVWWWVQMSLLAILFIKRVPESITLKSLNRIRPFCAILFGFLSLIALLFL